MATTRISDNQQQVSLESNLAKAAARQAQLFEKMGSKKRHLRISEDPVQTMEQIRIERKKTSIESQERSHQHAEMWISETAEAVNNSIEIFDTIYELAINAQDGAKNDQDRQGLASQVDQLLLSLLQQANAKLGEKYLFSGSTWDQASFQPQRDPATKVIKAVFYQGDNYATSVNIREGQGQPINLVGSNAGSDKAFGCFIDTKNGIDAFSTIIQLRDHLQHTSNVNFAANGGILQKLMAVREHLSEAQGRIASVQKAFTDEADRTLFTKANVEQSLQSITQINEPELMMEINQEQRIYSALLALAGRLQRDSLLNWMK